MRAAPPVALSPRERAELLRWTRGRSVPVRLVERARIVLLAAEGRTNKRIGRILHLTQVTVRRWRSRFALLGLAGISGDAPRSGHKSGSQAPTVAAILERTQLGRPTNGVRWTTRSLGRELGVSHTTIGKVWRISGVRPPRYQRWRLSPYPRFSDRLIDIAGIYVDPPRTLLALSIEPSISSLALTAHVPLRDGRDSGAIAEPTRSSSGGERLAEVVSLLDGLPPSAGSWHLTSRELLLFLESVNQRSPRLSEIHLLTAGRAIARDDRILRWIERHPRFHLIPSGLDRPISAVVRDWFQPSRTSPPASTGFPHLSQVERLLGNYLEGVALLGRPFAWTRNGVVSHWRSAPADTFSISSVDSARFSARARFPQ
jgi:transposase